jgi:hypothetical protein
MGREERGETAVGFEFGEGERVAWVGRDGLGRRGGGARTHRRRSTRGGRRERSQGQGWAHA